MGPHLPCRSGRSCCHRRCQHRPCRQRRVCFHRSPARLFRRLRPVPRLRRLHPCWDQCRLRPSSRPSPTGLPTRPVRRQGHHRRKCFRQSPARPRLQIQQLLQLQRLQLRAIRPRCAGHPSRSGRHLRFGRRFQAVRRSPPVHRSSLAGHQFRLFRRYPERHRPLRRSRRQEAAEPKPTRRPECVDSPARKPCQLIRCQRAAGQVGLRDRNPTIAAEGRGRRRGRGRGRGRGAAEHVVGAIVFDREIGKSFYAVLIVFPDMGPDKAQSTVARGAAEPGPVRTIAGRNANPPRVSISSQQQ